MEKKLQEEVEEVLDKSNQEEVDFMVSNLGKTLEKLERKATERGIEKKAKEAAVKAIELGLDDEIIIKLTGLTNEEINIIRRENSH